MSGGGKIVPFGKYESGSYLVRRRQLAAEIHAMLDRYEDFTEEDDADFEEGGDLEPSLGWTRTMALGGRDDFEAV